MIKGRNLDKLGADGEAASALQAISDLFGDDYLNNEDEKKPLSLLWNRTDRLATVELFIIGMCFLKILPTNKQWLQQTIREIKRCPDKSKGLFSEILYLGIFETSKSEIVPAPNKNPGYDFSIKLSSGNMQYISIKNVDISDEQKKFQAGCRKIRAKWREKLGFFRKNLCLRIASKDTLTQDDFHLIVKIIHQQKFLSSSMHLSPKYGIDIFTTEMPSSDFPLSPAHTSDLVIIYCPGAESEKKRYVNKVAKAADNLLKNTEKDANTLRVIFMRVHVNCDYSFVQERAKEIISDENSCIDCIICYQPSYTRNNNGDSLLHHCLKIELSPKFAMGLGEDRPMKANLFLGTASNEQANLKLIDSTNGKEIVIAPSDYMFQQGDIYKIGQIGDEITINSPAPGIREHGVCMIDGKFITFTSKITPKTDDLLLV